MPESSSPGYADAQGSSVGAGTTSAGEYRAFKPVLITEADDWKGALERAIKLTRHLGEYAAVECEVFTDELLKTE